MKNKPKIIICLMLIAVAALLWHCYSLNNKCPPAPSTSQPAQISDSVTFNQYIATTAEQEQCPNSCLPFRLVNGKIEPIAVIVVHHSATPQYRNITPRDIDNISRMRFDTLSYHVKIDNNGRADTIPMAWRTAGTKGMNTNTLSLCLIGGLDDRYKPSPEYPPPQRRGGINYIERITKKYPDMAVTFHKSVRPTACPEIPFDKNWLSDALPNVTFLYTKKQVLEYIAKAKTAYNNYPIY